MQQEVLKRVGRYTRVFYQFHGSCTRLTTSINKMMKGGGGETNW